MFEKVLNKRRCTIYNIIIKDLLAINNKHEYESHKELLTQVHHNSHEQEIVNSKYREAAEHSSDSNVKQYNLLKNNLQILKKNVYVYLSQDLQTPVLGNLSERKPMLSKHSQEISRKDVFTNTKQPRLSGIPTQRDQHMIDQSSVIKMKKNHYLYTYAVIESQKQHNERKNPSTMRYFY